MALQQTALPANASPALRRLWRSMVALADRLEVGRETRNPAFKQTAIELALVDWNEAAAALLTLVDELKRGQQ